MNLQAHPSDHISEQALNQAGTLLTGIPQQNIALPSQMQNPSMHRRVQNMDPEYIEARRFMTEKIIESLMQRRQQSHELPGKNIWDLAKRLEEGIFRIATSKEEYLNRATLESRLQFVIRLSKTNHNQQFSQVNTSSSMGTMIPTPGLPQTGNSSLMRMSSVDNSIVGNSSSKTIAYSTINSGNLLLAGNGSVGSKAGGSFSSSSGALANGYQPSSLGGTVNSVGNNTATSMSVPRITSQMIPTPGFSTFESTDVSQPMLQKQRVGQNSRILHNIGGHMGELRSTLQQKSYVPSNGPLDAGLGMMGNNMSLMKGPVASEGYLTGTLYGNSPKPLQQHFDQHQQSAMQGDRYGIGKAEASGSGNIHSPVTSVGSLMNSQSSTAVSLQSIPKTNSHLMINRSNMQSTLHTSMKAQSFDQSDKMNFQLQHSSRENLVQSPQQQYQQPSHHFQQQKLGQHQLQQKQKSQHLQPILMNDTLGQSQLSCSVGVEGKIEPGIKHQEESLHLQVSKTFEFSDLENQFPQNAMEGHSGGASHPSYPQDMSSSRTQTSDQIQQLLHPQQFAANTQNGFNSLSGGIHMDAAPQDQCDPKSQDVSHVSRRAQHDQNVHGEYHQTITGNDNAQRHNLSSEESMIGQSDATKSSNPPNYTGTVRRSSNLNREQQFKNQQRWLLYLRHARTCHAPKGNCQDPNCITARKLLNHIERCNILECLYPRCCGTKDLINHHRICREASCPVCIPVKNFLQLHLKALADSDFTLKENRKSHNSAENDGGLTLETSPVITETPEAIQPSVKRLKIENTSLPIPSETESSVIRSPAVIEPHPLSDTQHDVSHVPMESNDTGVKMEIPSSVGQLSSKNIEMVKDNLHDTYKQRPDVFPIISNNPTGFGEQEVIKIEKELDHAKQESTSVPSESSSKSGKPKIKGVSLIELFTPEQVREHITGLRQWVGQSKAKAEKNQAMKNSMSENSCQLCAVEKLTFEPPPIYCTPCGARIKRNAMYYTNGAGDTRHCFCIPCYNEARGDTIAVDGASVQKTKMEKKKNDEETEEWWVQCDNCEAWQHQICALFNGRRNDGGQADYTCPNCYVAEVERGERVPLPQNSVLGAKDLPRTILSDHIEQRLFRRLKQERQDRARLLGKSFDEVPGAEALVVRVVSSVDKKLEVKPRFLEIFHEENYPTEFPYKSKVVLLFQKTEGVEVCLFGMYVQEFGSECQQPNHRRVYLSYLDSVKYFRPEVKTVTGEALRTFVYHEILIGYLEYCKLRGFTSCYIWACPPLKGEDYILYCHPEIQKTPKSDKLREWYLSMLRKASKENIVVDLANLYDHFFTSTGECKAKVTAARLPYFDGDYWPGAAEDMIYQLQQEEDGRKQYKKGTIKKTITKRALKASGQIDLSGNASKDLLLMHKLGETISPMKEDFIMVHLQHSCNHCCILMVSGNRWVCRQCKNFQLCDRCYESEQKCEDRVRHPINQKEKHIFYSVEITDVPVDTKDRDEILESEFFDTRQAFLSLCQGNHYQYDTLRRAKHSSMMILYHLHNPTAPAFVTTCYVCHLDIEAGQGWHCEMCPDYDICNSCYQKDGGVDHPHKLTNNQCKERDEQNTEARQIRVMQLRKMLDLLVHASQCRSPLCQYPNCRKVKGLFRHGFVCKVRASGGCPLCKKMWSLLQLHSRACKESQCNVPRCRDLREHTRRMQQQSDSRRRAAVMEMMRQRAAEVAADS
ncbi:histone acetyltransferase HAC1-like isoform X2 [Olea europaea var. sylvestris]|uniref:histone acetyltransferase HAC1-like isoform X2 n=1 Tax=Olea europaea var. sylvestris TaxID=158386 RepID=UPI000C1D5A25|nr:histone acetyltransferase HAC1-like isoform X2 [Olea europaea var. sylvestris]